MKKKEALNLFEKLAAETISFTYRGDTYSVQSGKLLHTKGFSKSDLDISEARQDFVDLCSELLPYLGISTVDLEGCTLVKMD